MKTVETTFTPSEKSDNGVAEGTFTITGTDKEVQSLLSRISEIKDTIIPDIFVVGEFVRVNYENVQEYSKIYDVKDGAVTVEDMEGKMVDVPMTSVQIMGERRVLSLVGERVQKDIEVGDLVILTDDMLYECTAVGHILQSVALVGHGERHVVDICKFGLGDDIVTPDGLHKNVQSNLPDSKIYCTDGTQYDESELELWDQVTAVQRYAASFGMKVAVDVS